MARTGSGDASALRVEPVRETQLQKRHAERNCAHEKNPPRALKVREVTTLRDGSSRKRQTPNHRARHTKARDGVQTLLPIQSHVPANRVGTVRVFFEIVTTG